MAFEKFTQLPKRIYVKWEVSDDPYLSADEDRDELVLGDDCERVYVGTYVLEKTEKLTTKVVPA